MQQPSTASPATPLLLNSPQSLGLTANTISGTQSFCITSYPGHEILSTNEKRLCTNLKLTPAHYIRFINDMNDIPIIVRLTISVTASNLFYVQQHHKKIARVLSLTIYPSCHFEFYLQQQLQDVSAKRPSSKEKRTNSKAFESQWTRQERPKGHFQFFDACWVDHRILSYYEIIRLQRNQNIL